MAVDESGFEIQGRFYAMPQSFRLGDPVLVTQVTGLAWNEFTVALDDEERQQDPVVLLGMIAVAVWQGNPAWTRERAARYVQLLDIAAVTIRTPDVEADGDPPAVPATAPATSSPTSPDESNASPESGSEPTPPSSGHPGSDTGSQHSDPVT